MRVASKKESGLLKGFFVETQVRSNDHVEGNVNLPQFTTESWTSFMRKTIRRRVGEPWQICSKEKGVNQAGNRERVPGPMPGMENAMMESWLGRLTKVFRCDKPSCKEPLKRFRIAVMGFRRIEREVLHGHTRCGCQEHGEKQV